MREAIELRSYRIIDDSGVDYNFLAGGFRQSSPRWLGQIVKGGPCPGLYEGAMVVEKPFGLTGSYTCDAKCLEEVVMSEETIFEKDAEGQEMIRPRGPDWNQETRSWNTMSCRADWRNHGDRWEVAYANHVADLETYINLLQAKVAKLEGRK